MLTFILMLRPFAATNSKAVVSVAAISLASVSVSATAAVQA
jgi:hypothetical protein